MRSLVKPGDDAIAVNLRDGDLDGWHLDAGFAASAAYGVWLTHTL